MGKIKKTETEKTVAACECKRCKAFRDRIDKAIHLIDHKLLNHSLANIYHLILQQIPYLFIDGKAIAGFDYLVFSEESPEGPDDFEVKKPPYVAPGQLVAQPLTTLHLTERTLDYEFNPESSESSKYKLRDHYAERLRSFIRALKRQKNRNNIVTFDSELSITGRKCGLHIYGFQYGQYGNKDLYSYLGFNNYPLDKGGRWYHYDKNEPPFTYLSIVTTRKYQLSSIWCCDLSGDDAEENCHIERTTGLARLLTHFSHYFEKTTFNTFCVVNPTIKNSKNHERSPVPVEAIESYAFNKAFIDSILDKYLGEIYREIYKGRKTPDDDFFRVLFVRAQKPDVNSLITNVSPFILKQIYRKLKGIFPEKDILSDQLSFICVEYLGELSALIDNDQDQLKNKWASIINDVPFTDALTKMVDREDDIGVSDRCVRKIVSMHNGIRGLARQTLDDFSHDGPVPQFNKLISDLYRGSLETLRSYLESYLGQDKKYIDENDDWLDSIVKWPNLFFTFRRKNRERFLNSYGYRENNKAESEKMINKARGPFEALFFEATGKGSKLLDEKHKEKAFDELIEDLKKRVLWENQLVLNFLSLSHFISESFADCWEGCAHHSCLHAYITILTADMLERIPINIGIAYESGKRGVPEVTYRWQDWDLSQMDDPKGHPFYTKHIPKAATYPNLFAWYIDKVLLKGHDLYFAVPVAINGLLLGVFIVYPDFSLPTNDVSGAYTHFGNLLYDLESCLLSFGSDYCDALLLDCGRNVSDKLSNIQRPVADILKEVEAIVYDTHDAPMMVVKNAEDLQQFFDCYVVKTGKIGDQLKDDICNKVWLQNRLHRNKSVELNDSFFKTFGKGTTIENPYAKRWYVWDKPIDSRAQDKILLFSHKEELSPREEMNFEHLTNSVIEGLERRHQNDEIARHGTRAAITAIMSRNLSHNIGSHVLSYWGNELIEGLKSSIGEVGDAGPAESMLKKSIDLFQYIQLRMDFLAEVSTSTPSSSLSLDIEKDILDPFVSPYEDDATWKTALGDSRSVLLDYLAHSEKIQLHDRIEIKVDEAIKQKNTARVAIPNGLVGTHAIYSIIENFIRNAAKHYKGAGVSDLGMRTKVLSDPVGTGADSSINHEQSEEKLLQILVKEATGDWKDDYFAVEMWDMRSQSCTKEIVHKIRGYLSGKEKGFIDAAGSLQSGGWGIKEMLASANFLRNNPQDKLYSMTKLQQVNNDPPLFKILCGDNVEENEFGLGEPTCTIENSRACSRSSQSPYHHRFGIRFYLRKPKDLAVTLKSVACNGSKFIIDSIKCTDYREEANVKTVIPYEDTEDSPLRLSIEIPYKMLLVGTDQERTKYREDPKAPCRIVVNQQLAVIDDETYLDLYKDFIRKDIIGDCNANLPRLYFTGGGSGPIYEKLFEGNNCGAATKDDLGILNQAKDTDFILFFHHLSELKKVEIDALISTENTAMKYLQGLSGSYSCYSKFAHPSEDATLRRLFCLEVIEAALTNIVFVDERVSEWAKADYGDSVSIRTILDRMNIFVPEIELDNINIESLRCILGSITRKSISLFADRKEGAPKMHFVVIHQGILDKLEKETPKSADQLLKGMKNEWTIIDSGRGVPQGFYEKGNVRFVEISALLRMLQNYDKHGLVQTLFSLRKPGGNHRG